MTDKQNKLLRFNELQDWQKKLVCSGKVRPSIIKGKSKFYKPSKFFNTTYGQDYEELETANSHSYEYEIMYKVFQQETGVYKEHRLRGIKYGSWFILDTYSFNKTKKRKVSIKSVNVLWYKQIGETVFKVNEYKKQCLNGIRKV